AQAAYLFSERENGIYQTLDEKFAAGMAYTATVAITASPNIPPQTDTTLALTLYYTNIVGAFVPVATTTVTYNTNTFPNGTHLLDFSVTAHAVKTGDALVGKNIGVLIKSTT